MIFSRITQAVLAISGTGIGLMALLGHLLKEATWYGWSRDAVPMAPNTALAIVLLGTASVLRSLNELRREWK